MGSYTMDGHLSEFDKESNKKNTCYRYENPSTI